MVRLRLAKRARHGAHHLDGPVEFETRVGEVSGVHIAQGLPGAAWLGVDAHWPILDEFRVGEDLDQAGTAVVESPTQCVI